MNRYLIENIVSVMSEEEEVVYRDLELDSDADSSSDELETEVEEAEPFSNLLQNNSEVALNYDRLGTRGEFFSKNQYFFTNPKNGPARDSRDTLSLDSDISARTQKKAIFLHMVVIFLHGPKENAFFMHN